MSYFTGLWHHKLRNLYRPHPWEHATKGAGLCCVWIAILSSNNSNEFLILFLASPCSAFLYFSLSLSLSSLSLSLSLSHHELRSSGRHSSINELCSSCTPYMHKPTDIFHIATRSIKHGHAHGCCGREQCLLANTPFCYKNATTL